MLTWEVRAPACGNMKGQEPLPVVTREVRVFQGRAQGHDVRLPPKGLPREWNSLEPESLKQTLTPVSPRGRPGRSSP